jgi:thiopeptide-type bacteriocin biosynthesis protein
MSTDTEPASAAAPRAVESLYRALDFVLVRAPLLPVERYLDLADELELLSEPVVRRAVAVGSPSLLQALERFSRAELSERDAARMRAKLLRYQIRMSTRPTPFGLFAGVALAEWGDDTTLTIRAACATSRTRPDMAWLMALVSSAESNPAIRRQLSLVANPLARVDGGRVSLPESVGGRTTQGSASIRATGVVLRALSLARAPIPYAELVARLCAATPSATPEKVDALLTQLWEQAFLCTDVRPPLTIESPARYVADRLRGIREADDIRARLDALLADAAAWDALDHERSVPALKEVFARAGRASESSPDSPIQVDMALSVEGHLGRSVANDAARAVEILLRLSPTPRGLSSLAAYRQSFQGRYGHDREVPLLELLDPRQGLGPPSSHGHHAVVGPDPPVAARRAQVLLHVACTALRDRQRVVSLDEATLAALETWRPRPEQAPLSLDINLLVGARTPADIDRGDFTVVVGPNLGALAAGRNLGRFADLLGPGASRALTQSAEAERSLAPDDLWAELVYLPANLKSANVVIRPPIRPYEVPLGVSAGVSPACVVPLDELVVGVDQGRFYVRWPGAGRRVIVTSGHMLNMQNAPPVGRFLVDLSLDGRAIFSTFDWGPCESFPYLPRVQAGRVVLRVAQWRLQKSELDVASPEAFHRSVSRWRTDWQVPRHVCLSVADNRLVLDLDRSAEAAELRTELRPLADGAALTVQEVYPPLDETWLPGPNGHYYGEFTVSLVRRAGLVARPPETGRKNTAPPSGTYATTAPIAVVDAVERPSAAPDRLHPPGSDWLFVKLYGPRDLENDVVGGSLLTFAENAVVAGLADAWFFIRYSDPEPHLRLRFHGLRDRLVGQLFGQVCDWASELMSTGLCHKFLFDTYEQEIERFGGPAAITLAEAVFGADSRAVAELVRAWQGGRWPHDRIASLALTIDDLLAGLGLGAAERLRWYRSQATPGGHDIGSEYRQRKTILRALLGRPHELASQPGGDAIDAILATRRGALSPHGIRIRELVAKGVSNQSLDALCASFVHLHANRLGAPESLAEQRVLSLLLRTREGLDKAPL